MTWAPDARRGPLYRACGYAEAEPPVTDNIDGIEVPLVRMEKRLV